MNLIWAEVRASERKWLNLVAEIMLLTKHRAQNTSKSVQLEDQTISIFHAEVRHSLLLAGIDKNVRVTFYRICQLHTDKSPQAKMSVSLPCYKIIVWCSHWIFWNILTSMIFAFPKYPITIKVNSLDPIQCIKKINFRVHPNYCLFCGNDISRINSMVLFIWSNHNI